MIVQPESVSSLEDAVVKYINHLLQQQAVFEHVSANTMDERARRKVSDLTAVVEDLEAQNRDLRAMIEQQTMAQTSNLTSATDIQQFSVDMYRWCRETFGAEAANNPQERALRLVEEAVEVAQSVGVTKGRLQIVTEMVYGKPPGQLEQELGGVLTCWAVMMQAFSFSMTKIMDDASRDCWKRQSIIRDKHAAKVKIGAAFDPKSGRP